MELDSKYSETETVKVKVNGSQIRDYSDDVSGCRLMKRWVLENGQHSWVKDLRAREWLGWSGGLEHRIGAIKPGCDSMQQ